jgi:WD40 repeat protein
MVNGIRRARTFFRIFLLAWMLAACAPLGANPTMPTLETIPSLTPAPPATATQTPPASTLTPTAASSETPPPVPTTVPTGVLPTPITRDNANRLQRAGQASSGGYGRLLWSADSQSVAVQTQEELILYRLDPLTEMARIPLDAQHQVLAISPDRFLLATFQDENTLQVIEPTTGEVVQTIEQDGLYTSAAFSPDGQILAISSINEIAASLWNVPEGREITTLRGFETAAPIYGFSFSSSGRYLVWLARATVQVESIDAGELGPALSHEDFVLSLATSPDDHLLATSQGETVDGTFVPVIKMWEPLSGEALGRVILQESPSSALSFSIQSDLLAGETGSTVTLWDTASLSEAAVLEGHSSAVVSLAFSPHGGSLASLDESGDLILWQPGP